MAEPTLIRRVEILEEKVESLHTLPDRMTTGFAGLREEMRAGDVAVRQEMKTGFTALRDEIRALDTALRKAIQAGDEETRRYMRVLHEDVIVRIKTLGEAMARPPRKPRRS
jgi:hypothetical protein